jgi:hypothetical protein
MKTTILALIAVGFCAATYADSLVTTDGTHYDNITMKRVDPDGLYIEYTLPGNGMGMSKVKFNRLPDDQQKQFDAAKAREFEAQCNKATEDWRAAAARSESEARTTRAQQEAQANQDQTQRLIALAQLKQAEADLARASGGVGYGGGYDEGWGGGYAIPGLDNGRGHAKTTYAPVVTPVPWPRVNSPLHTRSR